MSALRRILAAIALLVAGVVHAGENSKPLVVFAAASLTEAISEVATGFTRDTGIPVLTSFAASSTLARQIEAGAAAGVFLSADEAWMDYLEQRGLLASGTRRDVLGNALVLIVPADSPVSTVPLDDATSLLSAVGNARIATGDPDTVPAGRYARAALTALGAWDQLGPRIVPADNVRSALAFVARGEARFGIVYMTDARMDRNVRQVGVFPSRLHPPIRYPMAVTARGDADARRFADYVASPAARPVFREYGLVVLGP